ncbi:TolC family outer membrane protein [Methylosinus sp. Sm6]|uniref:TolC family outer membrane protein n=1 Tax=Methylosinus sp. Sm6 TaxID=2866948 RepID=UPI001C997EF2|nr:TolC family outer membrane protein [Methylosinus sp. Sm6]MBY6242441.1 TolC family outer membrane protein [Methylosinus sp. Sm6]
MRLVAERSKQSQLLLPRFIGAGLLAALALSGPAQAETLKSALARAYHANPDLQQQRANVRARDEDAPKAAAGLRPRASITASAGPQFSSIKIPAGRNALTGDRAHFYDEYTGYPRGAALNLSQTLFDGDRTGAAVRQAMAGIDAARASLRLTEQTILQNGATAYMNVLRDTAVLDLRKNNIAVLAQQLRMTRDRYEVGEVTRTDVAQAEATLAQARTEFYGAQAQLKTTVATYRQIIGAEPKNLQPARAVDSLLPKSLDQAIAVALVEHPGVVAALHQADSAEHAVKAAEGALAPTLSVGAQVTQQYDSYLGSPATRQFSASATGQLNVPIYQGGAEYASIRQAKEQLGQARFNADLQRDSVRASVVSSYGQLDTAKASIVSSEAAVKAAAIALQGVREEARVGQRTTLDVLNAQYALLNARVALIGAQRDRVVASYAALGAIGRLSATMLALDVATYDPRAHFESVKDRWIGVDASDGR